MKTAFLTTPEDLKWLRDTHLRGVPLPCAYEGFAFAVLQGNGDAPYAVNLYRAPDPLHTDDYLRIEFDKPAPVYCEYCEFDGRTNQPKRRRVTDSERGAAK